MHNHWKTIQSLGNELKQLIVGYAICNCYSKSKDDLYIEFENTKEVLGLKSIFHPKGIFFTKDISKFKSSKDQKQFGESINETVIDVITYPYERCFLIELTSQKSILFKCFGVHANVIYFEDHKPVKIFRQSLLNDLQFDLDKLNHSSEKNIEVVLKNEAYQLISLDDRVDIYANKELYKSYQSIYDAFHDFSKLYLSKVNFETLKNQLQSSYQNQLNKLRYKLEQVKNKQIKLSAERPKDEIANIIMANIHQYNGSEEWELIDFYTNESIIIHLKRNQTPTQLAAQLYQKHKNKNIESSFIRKQIEELEKQITQTELILQTINSAKHISEIEKYKKDKVEPETATSLFKSFKIEGWDIYVGKNAKNNDELTFNFASKNDLWLHARGYSGSHVVIKNHSNQTIPKNIIEEAAKIAGYFSKGSNNHLLAIDYTFKKYVSRIKKGMPGQVQLIKHLTIDIKPELPEIKKPDI